MKPYDQNLRNQIIASTFNALLINNGIFTISILDRIKKFTGIGKVNGTVNYNVQDCAKKAIEFSDILLKEMDRNLFLKDE